MEYDLQKLRIIPGMKQMFKWRDKPSPTHTQKLKILKNAKFNLCYSKTERHETTF